MLTDAALRKPEVEVDSDNALPSMNDLVAIRDFVELVIEAKTVSRPVDSVDDKGSPLAIEANNTWPGEE